MANKVQNPKHEMFSKMALSGYFDCIKRNWVFSLIISLAFIIYLLVVWRSGSVGCIDTRCGMHFWGANEHDGVWHIALSRVSFDKWPFIFPTYSGAILSGYNFLLDIIIWSLGLLRFSHFDLYFRILPLVWFVFFAFVLNVFSKDRSENPVYRIILFLAVFFSSSFGFIIQFTRNGNIWGSSGNPTMQGALGMTNPQFMWSLSLLLLLILLLQKRANVLLITFISFLVVGFKVYSIAPLAVIFVFYLLKYLYVRKYRYVIFATIGSIVAIFLAYFLFYFGNPSSGILASFMAIPKQMIEDPNMWFQQNLVREWYTLSESHQIGPKFILVCAQILSYFIFFNYGIRIIGLFSIPYYFFKRSWDNLFRVALFGSIVVFTTILPIVFVQSGDWWNTIQFMYFGIIFSNFLLAETIFIVWSLRPKMGGVLIVVCLLLFLPANLDLIRNFGLGRSSLIPNNELAVLSKLSKMDKGIIYAQPFEKGRDGYLPEMYDTAYVSAISGMQTYFADQKQLELLNIPFAKRQTLISNQSECAYDRSIKYVYLRKLHSNFLSQRACLDSLSQFRLIDGNEVVELWMRD